MKLLELIGEAANNLMLHLTRSTLAMLGIIFGVASVICMLSIGEVARQDAVQRIERLGIHNVILDSEKPDRIRRQESQDNEEAMVQTYGITKKDLRVLSANLSAIEEVVPMRTMMQDVSANQRLSDVTVVGTTPNYSEVMDHRVRDGRFISAVDEANLQSVCVLGDQAAKKLFPLSSPLGKVVRIGGQFFTVVGVMERKGQTGVGSKFSDPDNTAFLPFASTFARFGALQIQGGTLATELEVNRAVLRVNHTDMLKPISTTAQTLLSRTHKQDDVRVTIPLSLIKEQQKAAQIFKWVMGSLAAISLLVGGIGIMNIMLANMAERKSEIGLRRALGASQSDIVSLFVSESLLMCFLGGALGIAVGFGLAHLVGALAQWAVDIQLWTIPLGVVVSLVVGLLFGTLPAIRAARLDPVSALRAE